MRKVEVVSSEEVKVEPFVLSEFFSQTATSDMPKKVSKKALKKIADGMGLEYEESQISFTKKIINAYIKS